MTTVVGLLAAGKAHGRILADHPDLVATLAYPAEAVREREIPLVG